MHNNDRHPVSVGCRSLMYKRREWCSQTLREGEALFNAIALYKTSESFWTWGIEAAVLAAKGAEAAFLDEEVEVLGGKVGGALAQLLHL